MPLPQVWDADALNLLAGGLSAAQDCVITPHPGRRRACWGSAPPRCRPIVRRAARRWQEILSRRVLKGAGSLIAHPDGRWRCASGHPAMAGAGLGDVLAG
jgi:NAD(P)H-hydrate epimerase